MASAGSSSRNQPATNSVVPAVLSSWLRARYPTMTVRQEWLEGCVEYLLESALPARPTDRTLIRQTNQQLLHADLADSTENGVLPADVLTRHKHRLGERNRGILLQIVGIMAQTQLDVLAALKEARLAPPRLPHSNSNQAASGAAAEHDRRQREDRQQAAEDQAQQQEGEEDHMSAFHSSETQLASLSNPTIYPRSLIRLHLSDGHAELLLPAFEHSRIEALSMNGRREDEEGGEEVREQGPQRTLLGCKVLLKGSEVRRGQVLLRPGEVEILGGSIPELEARAEYILTNSLRVRLGKSPEPEEEPPGQG
ncbi:hypothetical protein A4X03_0g2387 [Tilletia caries]|uniref:RecQ-mediated genome instability protein 1 n=1 Tax=Tilletia caries TaxID=13290 RepID=A0A8T8TKH7_9BASI|nr:hypothetical protein A4X03_0g2387 [Tilletia caries]